jgi:hypothetical protein
MSQDSGGRTDSAAPATYGYSAVLVPLVTSVLMALMITIRLWVTLADYGNNTDRLCLVPMLWVAFAPFSTAAGGAAVRLFRRRNASVFADIAIGILVPGIMLLVLCGVLAQ